MLVSLMGLLNQEKSNLEILGLLQGTLEEVPGHCPARGKLPCPRHD